jgi:hypothetical protein
LGSICMSIQLYTPLCSKMERMEIVVPKVVNIPQAEGVHIFPRLHKIFSLRLVYRAVIKT